MRNGKLETGNAFFRYNGLPVLLFCETGIICLMNISTHSGLDSVRLFSAGVWGFLFILIILAPILASHAFHVLSAAVYIFFSGICHQIPERSFWISEHPLAVCHRCSGIYLGLFLGSLIKFGFVHRSPQRRRKFLIAAISVLLMDALLPYAGLWRSAPFSRFLTGLLFGIIGSTILARGVAEFVREFSWRRFLSALCISKEAFDE